MTRALGLTAAIVLTGCNLVGADGDKIDVNDGTEYTQLPQKMIQMGGQILASCGASTGVGYIQPDEGSHTDGFIRDGISNGVMQVVKLDDGRVDLQVTDAAQTFSTLADGADILPVGLAEGATSFALIVKNNEVSESPNPNFAVYNFAFDANGTGLLVWTRTRTLPALLVPNEPLAGSLFVARCIRY